MRTIKLTLKAAAALLLSIMVTGSPVQVGECDAAQPVRMKIRDTTTTLGAPGIATTTSATSVLSTPLSTSPAPSSSSPGPQAGSVSTSSPVGSSVSASPSPVSPSSSATIADPGTVPSAATPSDPNAAQAVSTAFVGKVWLTHDMKSEVFLNGILVPMLIDTTHQCSWIASSGDFQCLVNGAPTDLSSPNACHANQTYYNTSALSLTPSYGANNQTVSCDYYDMEHTRAHGHQVDGMLKSTGPEPMAFSNIILANQLESRVFELDNFAHRAAGVLSVFDAPNVCQNDTNQFRTTSSWRTGLGGNNTVYIAARRNTDNGKLGVLSRGPYPPYDPLIGNFTANASVPSVLTYTQSFDTWQCSHGIIVQQLSYDGSAWPDAVQYAPKAYKIDTMARFNVVPAKDAQAIAKLYDPPAAYNETTGLATVRCNATVPRVFTGVVIGDTPFYIYHPGDLIVHNYPPVNTYGTCFTAWRGAVIDGGHESPYRLGWPFLRNTGVGLDMDTGMLNITSRPSYPT